MDWRYTLSDVRLSEEAIAASLEALRSNWLTMGPRTQALEGEWAARFGADHGVAVSSGSAALHLACRAVGVGPGDEVIVPATSFVADAHAPHWCGGEAVFADVASVAEPLLDRAGVEARLSERTKAVIVVHMFGYAAPETGAIAELCAERGIALIEDCCESAGAELPDGRETGSAGDIAAWSLFSKSNTPVGEGGIVTTDDEGFAERIRLWRSHAMTSVTWDRHRGHAETYDVVDLGFNYRIDEPRAALARAQLPHLEEALSSLRAAAASYRSCVEKTEGVEIPFDAAAGARAAHYAMPVLLSDRTTRDAVRATLAEDGVQTSFYPSLSQLSLYAEQAQRNPTPVAEEFADRHLTLPLWRTLGHEEAHEICCVELAAALAGVAG